MNEDFHQDNHAIKLSKNRFVVLIGSSILVALFLVSIALAIYGWSGAAQVDLSRPGYSGVRTQVSDTQEPTAFPSSGPINKDVLDDFEKLYNKTANQITAVNAFESGTLSDESLRINEAASTTSNQ